jgi:uridylate kinase
MKATKVDGIYDADPMKDPNAVKFEKIAYTEAINKELKVMDTSALALCRENQMPILVFKMGDGNLERVIEGDVLGTLVN